MISTPQKIRSAPGIQRDGTRLASDYYLDGQWCRFQRGLPRKIGGYVSKAQDLQELIYGMHSFAANMNYYLHLGSANILSQRVISSVGSLVGSNDRTPPALVGSADNVWSQDVFYDTNFGNVLVAHAGENLNIANQTDAPIFYGPVTGAGTLSTSGQDSVSGGVIVVGNYLIGYGNDGLVQWSDENNLATATLGAANVTQQKIVTARRIRGGGVPAALLWSLDSVVQMTFNDPATVFWDFDTLTDDSSILSSRGVVEYDGTFFWPGVDRFLMYNGVVREVPNQVNLNFFFDNLNFEQRQKVFAVKVSRFGEIWWFFPSGSATECDHAVIFNVREGSWYDTALDEGRTDGLYAKVYFKPFMTGATIDGGRYDLWQHETGVNRVRVGDEQPIPSHFETQEFNVLEAEQPQDKVLSVDLIEPDFLQTGEMTVTARGRANARSSVIDLPDNVKTITETAADSSEQLARFKTAFRLLSFKFESNALNGDYQCGENIAHLRVSDGRQTQ